MHFDYLLSLVFFGVLMHFNGIVGMHVHAEKVIQYPSKYVNGAI